METYKPSVLHRLSSFLICKFEKFFYLYGKTVANRPWCFIFVCLLITFTCSLGLIKFSKENRPFKLWIPQDSDFIKVMEWQTDNFPQKFRVHIAIYEAENVLTKELLLEILRVHDLVKETVTTNATWSTTCAKLPIITWNVFDRLKRAALVRDKSTVMINESRRKRRQAWWLSLFSREDYCSLLKAMPSACMEHSILEIWGYDKSSIDALDDDQIILDINQAKTSAVFGIPTNFSKFLGTIEQNSLGQIIKAKATKHIWITEVNEEEVKKGNYVDDQGLGTMVDKKGFEWENEFIKALQNDSQRPEGMKVYLMAASSFGQISGSTIQDDAKYLAAGFFIVFLYVVIMLGKFNLIEQRPLLSLFGISCVCLSIGVSYGLSSLFGIPFGPVNNVLPFLLLGLGIDDMFVIIQSWNNLQPKELECDLNERIGYALKHAGVSITITSLTDFVAFAIGATTVLPALRSFCLYAAIGIITVYFFQATFFVAWLSLDQKRLEESRQGCFWCIKLENWSTNSCSQQDLCQSFFKNVYAKFLLKMPVKIFVLNFTAALIGVSCWGLYNLEQEFNPIWFLPQNSYLFKFFVKLEEHYPSDGEDGIVFFGNISLFENLNKIDKFVLSLENREHISEVDSWYSTFKIYWGDLGYNVLNPEINETTFLNNLSEFLHSPSGSKYRFRNFNFDGILNCTDPTPPILASTIEYKHKILHGSANKIGAMEDVKNIVKSMNFSGYVEPWARMYSGWETDKIIEMELYRNLSLALVVVFVMTLALIASFTTSCLVLLCVTMTLIDVGALMHWWGLTIDTVSCIDLVLAVGLCVDYAAHVGHTFMTQKGSRNQRVKDTLAKIGPAVLNGGFSTFLAFVFLAGSYSHVFKSFFKIFFAVCLYGLYHGLVFLPVLLSLIGPPSYTGRSDTVIESTNLELSLEERAHEDPSSQQLNSKAYSDDRSSDKNED